MTKPSKPRPPKSADRATAADLAATAATADTTDTADPSATRYVALLRGINVGGHARVPMETLRGLLTDMGGTAVRTHLQSGNAVFTHGEEEPEHLAAELEQRIRDELGLTVTCLVRTATDLRRVADANPFAMEGVNGSRFLVVFLSGPPPRDKLATLDPAVYAPDEFRAGEREIYAHFPDSIRNSKLAARFSDRWLGLTATARNWNTVVKLVELSGP
ncbi:hypothetical protein RVR_7890 [Actinacidiphila reveromycinica]|uniref:DUF1697 domain-containing protein n=1 Tax=Actinacidiphila reveromycinica TaxID=659352 RepID=A0A7U3VRE0_9ACTN|nr:DUF1697 domain-containing protein [Streptomyces sp. SN-593]BBB00761.1 hypothetical protein RVR_7890 [Streptomyces sp. SN-593]